ncbi:MAG: ABC transporter substrate-binding protein [Hyphomonadaceae bacterium]|nr:ABC transporter substrate-binding protein [Hyphomonadaceae bacterium]
MRWLIAILCAMCVAAPAHAQRPQRIVSLDYCADQFVLALADREQIAALSRGALRDDSYFRERARALPRTRGTMEEVLALRADLIVRTWGGPWDAEVAYARFGIRVLSVGDARDFAGARADILKAARAIGQDARGAAIASNLDRRVAALRAMQPQARPQVLYMSAGGAVAGRGTMLDAVIDAAGGRNVRVDPNWTVFPLERMLETPPALIALGFFDHGRERMNAWSRTRHPALQRALANARTVELPIASIACDAWLAIDAAEVVAAAIRNE